MFQSKNPYLPITERMNMMQRWVIVNSFLYYNGDGLQTISDRLFDEVAYKLADLQKKHPESAQKTQYWYMFYDFDGTTGYHLWDRVKEEDKPILYSIIYVNGG